MFFAINNFCKVIAGTVASDPEKYNEAFLGKPNGEYCNWIRDYEKWGGRFNFFFSCLLKRCCNFYWDGY
jgi:hypothetical protein